MLEVLEDYEATYRTCVEEDERLLLLANKGLSDLLVSSSDVGRYAVCDRVASRNVGGGEGDLDKIDKSDDVDKVGDTCRFRITLLGVLLVECIVLPGIAVEG